jgi:hypothetical protein
MYFCHAYGVAFGERIFCSIQVDKNMKLMAFVKQHYWTYCFFFSLQTVVDFIKKKKEITLSKIYKYNKESSFLAKKNS